MKLHRWDLGLAVFAVGFGVLGQTMYELVVTALNVYLLHAESNWDSWIRFIAGAIVASFFVFVGRREMNAASR